MIHRHDDKVNYFEQPELTPRSGGTASPIVAQRASDSSKALTAHHVSATNSILAKIATPSYYANAFSMSFPSLQFSSSSIFSILDMPASS